MRHPLTSEKAKLAEALKTHPVCSRSAARAAGLKLFTGPLCPVRSHGIIRRVSDGQCVECLEAAERIKAEAREAGRAAALKKARAEVAREQKAAERERLKQEKAAEREREKAERVKAAKAAARAKRKAERLAAAGEQGARSEPLEVPVESTVWEADEGDDESPPWEIQSPSWQPKADFTPDDFVLPQQGTNRPSAGVDASAGRDASV